MYHFVEDKVFLKSMKHLCSEIINQLVQIINNEGLLEVEAHLVGSGAKNLITQNAKEPIDLDYNLCIVSVDGIMKEYEIKEYVRKKFNLVLKKKGWGDCSDSTSALTTSLHQLKVGNKTKFSIDLAIVKEENKTWYRMKHEKTGNTKNDKWYWNESPTSTGLLDRVNWIKSHQHWGEVEKVYLNKKNMYLSNQDYNHPSFVCYIEAVNEVYGYYTNTNGNKQTNKQQLENIVVNAALNMKYSDNSHRTFYCSYIIDGKTEVKSPMYDNNTSVEYDYELVMRWLNKLTTVVSKNKKVTKLVINTSQYISDMICDNKLGDRKMNDCENNRIRSYLGRVKKLGIEVVVIIK